MHDLQLVITGKKTMVSLPQSVIPTEVTEYMESLGYEHEMDSNGWQQDFWITYTKKGAPTYMYSGCWYYGGHDFSLEETDEDEIDEDVEASISIGGPDIMQSPAYLEAVAKDTEIDKRIDELCAEHGVERMVIDINSEPPSIEELKARMKNLGDLIGNDENSEGV